MIKQDDLHHNDYPLPCPIDSLTLEQSFVMRQMELTLINGYNEREDLVQLILGLVEHNFKLTNNLEQLVKKW